MTKRAILQVENTDKVVDLARFLVSSEWTIVSSGKTGDLLRREKISFDYEDVLSAPESNPFDTAILMQQIVNTNSEGFDGNNIYIICINVEPQAFTTDLNIAESKTSGYYLATLVRNAYVNYKNVLILTDPEDYEEAMIQLRTDSVSSEFRLYLAGKALNMVSAFDGAISANIFNSTTFSSKFMNYLTVPFKKSLTLHNGSNPQQSACLYIPAAVQNAMSNYKKLQGKELSYNMICDISMAWDQISTVYMQLKNQYTVKSINNEGYEYTSQFTPLTGTVFTVAIKYKNIIGAALSTNVIDSFKKTYTYDSESINESVLGCSAVIDKKAAEELINYRCVAIVAPSFTEEAKEIFSANKNIRLIPTSKVDVANFSLQLLNGGMLFQTRDKILFEKWNVKTRLRPSQKQTDELALGMLIAMNTRSFSAVLLRSNAIVGISQGCSSQKSAIKQVLSEANEYIERNQAQGSTLGDILVCDSTIPFCNEVRELIEKGVSAIIQTGGTSSDDDFIKFCDERGVVMIFTNMTHIVI